MNYYRRRVIITLRFTAISYALLLATNYLVHISQPMTTALGLLLAIALLPSDLLLPIIAERLKITHPLSKHHQQRLNYFATANLFSRLSIVVVCLGAAVCHLTPMISAGQLLVATLLAQLLPAIALYFESSPPKLPSYQLNRHAISRLISFGIMIAGLSFGSYLIAFAVAAISPQYIDPSLPLQQQATAVVYLTFTLCSWLQVFFERSDQHEAFFSQHMISNRRLIQALIISTVLTLTFVYSPLSDSQPDLVGWLISLATASLYALAHLLQRHTRQHSRHAIIDLVSELHNQQ